MNQENYQAEVVRLERIRLAGMMISTIYASASKDCPALWSSFCEALKVGSEQQQCMPRSFGVSIMTGAEGFDYMAGIEIGADEDLPLSTVEFYLPEGSYLKCVCPSLDKIGEVFGFMYQSDWVKDNTDLNLDFERPCFEEYAEDYPTKGILNIYAPLKR